MRRFHALLLEQRLWSAPENRRSGRLSATRVAHRTFYVRFGTKAELLKRVIDVAITGDAESIDVPHRDWYQAALTGRNCSSPPYSYAATLR
jgi:hypothetical protein